MVENHRLNFVLINPGRSGAAALQSALASHQHVVCHTSLLDNDPAVRRRCHDDYFGVTPIEALPDWLAGTELSLVQYLTTRVFDQPQHGETAIGVQLGYAHLQQHDLWEYLTERSVAGDFAAIHVTRNPVACFVSALQAAQSETYVRREGESPDVPQPVWVDAKELMQYCRRHAATEMQVRQALDDRLEVEHRDLVFDFRDTLDGVFKYLEVEPIRVQPEFLRLRNRPLPARILNYRSLCRELPADLREFFNCSFL